MTRLPSLTLCNECGAYRERDEAGKLFPCASCVKTESVVETVADSCTPDDEDVSLADRLAELAAYGREPDRELRAAYANLTAVQTRCNELLHEVRAHRLAIRLMGFSHEDAVRFVAEAKKRLEET